MVRRLGTCRTAAVIGSPGRDIDLWLANDHSRCLPDTVNGRDVCSSAIMLYILTHNRQVIAASQDGWHVAGTGVMPRMV